MKNFLKIGLCAFLLGFTACHQKMPIFQSVNAEKFSKIITDKDVQIVDVRTPQEFSDGHIANSINLDVKSKDFPDLIKSELNKDEVVAIYCRSGRRSKKAAAVLNNAGFTVVELAGGFNEWQDTKGEVVK